MANEIISYLEMCQREGVSLQRGMNFGLGGNHSVILMSLRRNAPYEDELQDGGTVLIYEGHDEPRSSHVPDPKRVDQPEFTSGGALTQNGLFYRAAQAAKSGLRPPERVRVYEKLRKGFWSYNGVFHLVDAWRQQSNGRQVFKFKLVAVEGEEDLNVPARLAAARRRVIPTHVKLEVWKRDGGRCVICGATDELHFDHIVPYSRGGTSLIAENVQLLCARHNLGKHDRIE
ncbi:MAG: HNH endonuclease [Candidatus Sumerlaeia bacterium]|nr:HNH endonuclease [Candidatus Sumerlaeia bacterium]